MARIAASTIRRGDIKKNSYGARQILFSTWPTSWHSLALPYSRIERSKPRSYRSIANSRSVLRANFEKASGNKRRKSKEQNLNGDQLDSKRTSSFLESRQSSWREESSILREGITDRMLSSDIWLFDLINFIQEDVARRNFIFPRGAQLTR